MVEKTPEEIGREVAGGDEDTARLIAFAIATDREQRTAVITVSWKTTVTEEYQTEVNRRELYGALADGTAGSYLGDLETETSKQNVEVTERRAFVDGAEVLV